MKRLIHTLFLAILIIFSGCAVQPQTAKSKIDANLPTVTKVRTLSDIDAIALEWTPIYSEQIEGYHIYRGSNGEAPVLIHTVKDRYSSHYLDKGLEPNTLYTYQITVFTKNSESYPSKPVTVRTLPVPEAVPFVAAIDHLPREVKVIWRPHPYLRINSYILQRSIPQDQEWKDIATIEGRLSAEYIDKGLDDNQTYFYRVLARTCDGIYSQPSKIVQANTKPRPAIVKGLSASKNLPKKIILQWLPNQEPDIVYYKIYKSIFEIGPYLVVAKTKKTKYIDLIDKDGVKRYYKVTAVDKDGLESFKQDVPAVGITLGKPLPPVIVKQLFDGKRVYFSWSSSDNRAFSYMVKKREILDFFKYNDYTFKNLHTNSFSDDKLVPGAKYIYKVYAVDKNGIVSEASEEIVVKVPKK